MARGSWAPLCTGLAPRTRWGARRSPRPCPATQSVQTPPLPPSRKLPAPEPTRARSLMQTGERRPRAPAPSSAGLWSCCWWHRERKASSSCRTTRNRMTQGSTEPTWGSLGSSCTAMLQSMTCGWVSRRAARQAASSGGAGGRRGGAKRRAGRAAGGQGGGRPGYLNEVAGESGEATGRGQVPQDAAIRRQSLLHALQQLGHCGHPLLLGSSLGGADHLLDRLAQGHVGALEALPVVPQPEQGVLRGERVRARGQAPHPGPDTAATLPTRAPGRGRQGPLFLGASSRSH